MTAKKKRGQVELTEEEIDDLARTITFVNYYNRELPSDVQTVFEVSDEGHSVFFGKLTASYDATKPIKWLAAMITTAAEMAGMKPSFERMARSIGDFYARGLADGVFGAIWELWLDAVIVIPSQLSQSGPRIKLNKDFLNRMNFSGVARARRYEQVKPKLGRTYGTIRREPWPPRRVNEMRLRIETAIEQLRGTRTYSKPQEMHISAIARRAGLQGGNPNRDLKRHCGLDIREIRDRLLTR